MVHFSSEFAKNSEYPFQTPSFDRREKRSVIYLGPYKDEVITSRLRVLKLYCRQKYGENEAVIKEKLRPLEGGSKGLDRAVYLAKNNQFEVLVFWSSSPFDHLVFREREMKRNQLLRHNIAFDSYQGDEWKILDGPQVHRR